MGLLFHRISRIEISLILPLIDFSTCIFIAFFIANHPSFDLSSFTRLSSFWSNNFVSYHFVCYSLFIFIPLKVNWGHICQRLPKMGSSLLGFCWSKSCWKPTKAAQEIFNRRCQGLSVSRLSLKTQLLWLLDGT